MKPEDSFSHTLRTPGSYMFCALHPEQIRARIDVKVMTPSSYGCHTAAAASVAVACSAP